MHDSDLRNSNMNENEVKPVNEYEQKLMKTSKNTGDVWSRDKKASEDYLKVLPKLHKD